MLRNSSATEPTKNRQRNNSTGLAFALRALRARNYRLFFGGQSVSLVGTWMTRIATAWLVYRLTHSAWLLGLVGFAGQIPVFILGPLAGVWIDRSNRHRVLVVTQILSMLQSFCLAFLALRGTITVREIIFLNLFQGGVNAFDMPGRQAFVIEMVERREDLASAIALNSLMVNGARLIGPSIAGILIAAAGEGYCFLIDGFSYLGVVGSLLVMRLAAARVPAARLGVWQELAQGWRYVSSSVAIRSILLMLGLVSLVGMPYSVLMPIFAGSVLHRGAHALGFLMGFSGLGALGGAWLLASRKSVLGLGRLIPATAGLFGAALIAFSVSRLYWLSLVLMLAVGFGMMQQMAASNTILQTITEDDKRGRVMSFYSVAFQGMVPFGSLLAGAVASRFGAPLTLALSGSLCLAGALWFTSQLPRIRSVIRPIYMGLNIIPSTATEDPPSAVLGAPPET
jgi:MFS family permease